VMVVCLSSASRTHCVRAGDRNAGAVCTMHSCNVEFHLCSQTLIAGKIFPAAWHAPAHGMWHGGYGTSTTAG